MAKAKGESKRKAKAKKDPNAPKKGMTGFLHFVQAKKDKFKEENQNLTHKEVISKLGSLWQSLSDVEKQPYNQLAKDDKERYDRDKKEYDAQNKKKIAGGDKKAKNE